jgi:imidazolonepropionase
MRDRASSRSVLYSSRYPVYAEILERGGGILATVRATRAASEDELTASAKARLSRLAAEGITTVEIKSGYGLDLETEEKMIKVMRNLEELAPVTVRKTFLGAHALPAEYREKEDEYLDLVCTVMIPALADQVDFADVFCESVAFSLEQTERVFETARQHALGIKIHAEQLSALGGAALASGYEAVSADHLEYADEAGVRTMAQSSTTAVLLPGAFYFVRERQAPPVELLRRYKVPMAVSTDSNPGSSPCLSILLMLNMACTLFGLTPEEALRGVTVNAARALGMEKETGTLEPGKTADLALFDVDRPAELAYTMGANPCAQVWKRGRGILKRGNG